MDEDKKHEKQEKSSKKPDSEIGKDATSERVAEEESGGALPSGSSGSDES